MEEKLKLSANLGEYLLDEIVPKLLIINTYIRNLATKNAAPHHPHPRSQKKEEKKSYPVDPNLEILFSKLE